MEQYFLEYSTAESGKLYVTKNVLKKQWCLK